MEPDEPNPPKQTQTLVKPPRPVFEYIVILIVLAACVVMLLAIIGPQTGNNFGGGRITNGLSGT